MRTFQNEEQALEFINSMPWGTAAGTSKDPTMILKYAQAGAKIVHFGSITWVARLGNAGDNFYFDDPTGNSINAWGIPNRGFHAYVDELVELKKAVNALGSELWVSISAGDSFKADEYYAMTRMLLEMNAADVVAGNMSCPNMVVGGKRKPVVCFDIPMFEQGVKEMAQAGDPQRMAIKLAPITEASILSDLVSICARNNIGYIEGANTVGNCYMWKPDGSPRIAMVRGGGAGRMLAPIIAGMAQMILPQLKGTKTKFIAIGGIQEGLHAYEMLRLGVHGWEFNSILSARGGDPRVIHEMILSDDTATTVKPGLVDLLVERGLPG